MFKLEKGDAEVLPASLDRDLFEENDQGTDLPDRAAAREEALRFAQEIRSDLATPDRALVEVEDERGSTVWLLQFCAMVGGLTRRQRPPWSG
jgi:hypothetical protein